MKKCSFVSLLLLGALLASCGDGETPAADKNNNDTNPMGNDTATVTETDSYEYPELDCGGEPLRILNSSNAWGTYSAIDFEEETGEALDDAVFQRNSGIEERFNTKLEVTEYDIDQAVSHFSTVTMSGEDLYDLTYLRADNLPSPLTEGMFYDLNNVEGFRFTEPWWDGAVMKGGEIGDDNALFFASNYFSLFGFDATVCVYFNEQMFNNLDIEFPYQLVRDGKWTLERFYEYASLGANTNGDSSFAWSENGNAVYGVTTWSNGVQALLGGAGAYYLEMVNGEPVLSVTDEHFINTVNSLVENLFSVDGVFAMFNTSDNTKPDHYEVMFQNNRTIMTVAQIKTSSRFRDMEDSFGILPLPKYDEAQDGYSCYISSTQLMMGLPITSLNTLRTATVMDALAYESYRDVLPVYYEVKVSQKGLRNEDSIEMLDIIRANRYTNFGEIFGWTNALQSSVYSKISVGNADIASVIASDLKTVEKNIEKTMDMVNE
ncbi:MAG: hypothetical protein IJW77_10560 [Clostridia bacterium]|nr:hypothetical protein [Clostridia bacterium]